MDCEACNGKHVKHTCSRSRSYKKRKIIDKDVEEDKKDKKEEEMEDDHGDNEEDDDDKNDGDDEDEDEDEDNTRGDDEDEDEDDGDDEDQDDGDDDKKDDDNGDKERTFQINQKVFARWLNGLFYYARIIKIEDKIAIVRWLGKTKYNDMKVHFDDICNSFELEKGMFVLGLYRDGHMYPCYITKTTKQCVHVRWEDGSNDYTKINKNNISPKYIESAVIPQNLKIGEHIMCEYGNQVNRYRYPATIEKIEGKILKIRWRDNDSKNTIITIDRVNRIYELN